MQIDVFTLLPHAFSWLTEQRPLAAVLGTELELRLLSYRDFTPLRAGQVDDEPYGGGAGMVLRVDVVDAALEAVYGDARGRRVVALTPQGRQLDQQLVEELAAEERADAPLRPLRGLRRARRRAPRDRRRLDRARTSSPAASCRRWSSSTRSRAACPARSGEESARAETFSAALEGGARVPALHAPGRLPRLARPGRPPLGRPRPDRRLAARAEPRDERRLAGERPDRPDDRRAPPTVADVLDWVLTIAIAVGGVLAIKAFVVNPYRIPSSLDGADVPLRRARQGCLASYYDRVLANRFIYHFRDPERGDIVVFRPARAEVQFGAAAEHLREADHRPAGREDPPARTASSSSTARRSTSRTSTGVTRPARLPRAAGPASAATS